MSKLRRIRIDVYGRFRADVIRRRGHWVAYRLGADGKRSMLGELSLPDDATAEDVMAAFDAAYHELGGDDRELTVIDVLMA